MFAVAAVMRGLDATILDKEADDAVNDIEARATSRRA